MKNMKIWLVLFAVILAVGIIGSVFALRKTESSVVEIVQDGKVLYRLDLTEYKGTETIEIEYNGSRNTVLIEDSQICMFYANCPDQTCVKMGWLKSSAFPIVCLPHHLVIQYAESSDTVDGIVN